MDNLSNINVGDKLVYDNKYINIKKYQVLYKKRALKYCDVNVCEIFDNLKLNSDNTRNQEVPWFNSMNSGAGDGYSIYIVKPTYQKIQVVFTH